jgi:hypothetical protein
MSPFVIAAICACLGAAGLFVVGRRSFYRRNIAGIEEFDGYGRMLLTLFVERVLRVVSWFLLLGGLSMGLLLLSR